ncbi:uncharacterized protein [Gossypium hirsutum]|uniref:Uncharacterized protein LOC107913316 n=1 Tax=Gossypium hirsutum TaxID=3635 RepID=A0A1U8K8R6_GOSHI|nr:uncharacterized protein LOC107913316 [Gossypium hirsutum]XP_040960125.1 uncharacterized protein LOC107913316 [Gossypium hirsutum]
MLPIPPSFVQSSEGSLISNPDASAFVQQDMLLASWLLSIINPSLLSSFTGARMACDVWNTAIHLFAVVTGTKLCRLCHDLHSLEKGSLSVKEYVAKIQNTSALIKVSGSRISEAEKVEIVLAGLPPEFDAILTLESFSSEPLPLQCLINVLLEYESRQVRAVQDVPLHANLLEIVRRRLWWALSVVVIPCLEAAGEGFNLTYNVRFADGSGI